MGVGLHLRAVTTTLFYLFQQNWLQSRIQFLFYIFEENGGSVPNSVLEGAQERLFGELDHLNRKVRDNIYIGRRMACILSEFFVV